MDPLAFSYLGELIEYLNHVIGAALYRALNLLISAVLPNERNCFPAPVGRAL